MQQNNFKTVWKYFTYANRALEISCCAISQSTPWFSSYL